MHPIIACLILAALDATWITINGPMYNGLTRAVQGGRDMKLYAPGAVAAYVCIFALLLVFVLPMFQRDLKDGKGLAFALGRVWLLAALVYGIYDFTSLAIYIDFTWKAAIMDAIWGGTMFAIVCWASTTTLI